MIYWLHISLAVVSTGVLVILLVAFVRRWCFYKPTVDTSLTRDQTFQARIAKLHQPDHNLDSKRRVNPNVNPNYYVLRGLNSTARFFNWNDHPSLVTDAVENGWPIFGFTAHESASQPASSTTKSKTSKTVLLGLCAVGDDTDDRSRESNAEIIWEVCQGSTEFLQKIRLNYGISAPVLKNKNSIDFIPTVIRTALPLPGPHLGNSAFPQEAYFEITILSIRDDRRLLSSSSGNNEGERTKLIVENSDSVISSNVINKEESKKTAKECLDRKGDAVVVSVGLSCGGSFPARLPGSYQGSIGFNSDGSVHLDGIQLVFESEKSQWGKKDKIIGCGFDPKKKKVYFTVDSHLDHVINCKAEEFGFPLYPTLASTTEVVVLVNFGQCDFAYTPANLNRTANPCFIRPLVHSSAGIATADAASMLEIEDSKELFSMGRIDSQWLNRFTHRENNSNNGDSNHSNKSTRTLDYEEESDADLFEIVLDDSGKSNIRL